MENRIKEQQLELFADRTSTQIFESNQLRLWLSSMAYVLMQAFRQNCLRKTSLAQATVGTIRLSLLKLGARITVSIRRILIEECYCLPISRYFSDRPSTYSSYSRFWIILIISKIIKYFLKCLLINRHSFCHEYFFFSTNFLVILLEFSHNLASLFIASISNFYC